ncbi:MAG TPA: ABC transporter substrate-binding protein [Leifsonia sp.]|nr:ABC transporter substrate-binding protein [Leifsonia sp.]
MNNVPDEKAPALKLGSKDSFLPYLAEALGYFDDEGLTVEVLDKAQIKEWEAAGNVLPARVAWAHVVVFGAGTGDRQLSVMTLHDAPGISILVANHVKDQIRSAADFAGRTAAVGAPHSTKGMLTNYLATKAGLPSGSYTSMPLPTDGRLQLLTDALEHHAVDVLTFMEPLSSQLRATGLVSDLYDLTTTDAAAAALGARYLAESLMVDPRFAKEHPDLVQALVNVFVRTLQYAHSASAAEVAELLPATFAPGMDRAAAAVIVASRWGTLATDFSISEDSMRLLVDSIQVAAFDDSSPARARAAVQGETVDVSTLFTNQFLEGASAASK